MHLAPANLRVAFSLAMLATLTLALSGAAVAADRLPLVGSGATSGVPGDVVSSDGGILSIDPLLVPCTQLVNFSDVLGGDSPGTDYDGILVSGGLRFAERFAGQTLSYAGDFDVVSGGPTDPLTLQNGAAGQNLDVFAYTVNVLAGLGHLGFPDIDAIGEGSIAMYFPVAQSRVSFQLAGGNGGDATLDFYRADGSHIDTIVISGLGESVYGFATADATPSIAGILVQTTDPSGIGVVNICHDGGIVSTRSVSWGRIKTLYR